jgi:hypothetical protein
VELKEPGKSVNAHDLRGHDADQFRRFSELPIWALSNFASIRLYHRATLVEAVEVLPVAALDPHTTDNAAEAMVATQDHNGLARVLEALTWAGPPAPTNAEEVAETLAHAARLVREVVAAHCHIGLTGVLARVRDEFNDTLFARPEAGGYDPTEGDALFASAFAQTLIFGLLMAREAGDGAPITDNAYQLLPVGTYPLLRGTLRALTLDEVRDALGVAYTIARDAANAVAPELLRAVNGRDPMLYLYEDFLRVFDPEAVKKYGVYYTPPEVVQLIVAEVDHALRDGLGSQGLLDPQVNLLDPACGTGTFLIASAGLVASQSAARFGTGSVGAEVTGFAQRMNGFEILVGPYTVAHYRMLREVKGRGGTVAHLPIFLADTLAPPAGITGVATHLDFMGAPMVAEREAADTVKRDAPILAIMGNPPYRRLRSGEVARLVGAHISQLWDDLKRPVREAGLQRSLNAFPDLYIAFYRWALWRLFEAEHATRRGVVGFITNRGFLTGPGFGGLRQMLRQRFDVIRIIDFRGNNKGTRPADVERDENIFNIEVGVCVLIAYATGQKPEGVEAEVHYADVWSHNCFRRAEKLTLAREAAHARNLIPDRVVHGTGMDRLRPRGFYDTDWPGLEELMLLRSNGIVTYRDTFVYATTRASLESRIQHWLTLSHPRARTEFHDSALNKSGRAQLVPFDSGAIERVSYRPFDVRFLYNKPQYVDRTREDLQTAWGASNFALFARPDGTGEGPAVWCHGFKPDQHSFRGSGGGWVFPFTDRSVAHRGDFVRPALITGLSTAYGTMVTAEQVFDAILGLLSASSYTMRFGRDLEDDFPRVPFPADPATFMEAENIGRRIRALQTFTGDPNPEFQTARIVGTATADALGIPEPRRAYVEAVNGAGEVILLPDRSLRMTGVSLPVWTFSVSGYRVLYRWLKARSGESLAGAEGAALLRGALDLVWRIMELLDLYGRANIVLNRALEAHLTRHDLALPQPNPLLTVTTEGEEDDDAN